MKGVCKQEVSDVDGAVWVDFTLAPSGWLTSMGQSEPWTPLAGESQTLWGGVVQTTGGA